MYIVGFRRENLNENFDFENTEPIYKYICDIGNLKELNIDDIQDLISIASNYETIINTLDDLEEDYNAYIDINSSEDYEYTAADLLFDMDHIPVKKLLDLFDIKILNYIHKIVSNIYVLKSDINVISYFYNKYDFEKNDIYFITKYDDFIISYKDNKFNIKSDSGKINKVADWVNYI